MDKINDTPTMMVKLILILFLLLAVSFVFGVVIGKNGKNNTDRTSADKEGIQEKLAVCSFNFDQLRGRYLKLSDFAKEKGLIDENEELKRGVICREEKESKHAETLHETSSQEQPKPADKTVESESVEQKNDEQKSVESKHVETKSEETLPETSPSEKNKPAEKKAAEPKPVEQKKPDKNKTIDEILAEKNVVPKKDSVKKCSFSIQIFAANTKEQADAAAKKLKSLKPRVVSGENNGKQWYKLRTGCFASREAAEAELVKVRKSEKSAYIVSE